MAAQPSPSFWEDKKVTVTGGGGFLGKATVRQLVELGALVRVIRSSENGTGVNFGYAQTLHAATSLETPASRDCSKMCVPMIVLS